MNDSLKATFFAECEDLLEALSSGLAVVSEGAHDAETVNAIFRAVHSIKGAAGAFALTDLVNFAHRFETVLDRIRSGTIEIDAEVLRIITRSSDVLADLVEAAQSESGAIPEAMDGLVQSLTDLGEAPAAGGAAAADAFAFEPVAFAPICLDLPAAERVFHVAFTPHRALYENGHEPARLFAALAELGAVEVRCDTSRLPELDRLDPAESYLSWTIVLRGDIAEGRILQVFSFVEGLCDLTVDLVDEGVPHEPPALLVHESDGTDKGGAHMAPVDTPAPAAGPVGAAPGGAPKAARPATPGQPAAAPAATLRVDPERVDKLINTVGELIINHAVITQKVIASGIPQNSDLMADLDDYRHLAREIQEGVMAIRAQPVKPLFQRMARIVREAAEATGKDVVLVTEGEATEVDKTLVERLADPLTHMVRNAVDHGIEPAERRAAAGKPLPATVRLSAAHRSGHVQIEVADDGGGLNRERVLQTAIAKGLVSPDAKLSEAEIDNLLFLPGFSTASTVTNLSGRGVGMDVVKTTITSLGGRLTIASEPGRGSVFTISLPLTLAVLDGMVVSVGSETMVLPLASIVETVRPRPGDFMPIGPTGTLLSIRGAFVPVVCLGDVLGLGRHEIDASRSILVLIRTETGSQVALAVDGISDQRQVVIKSLEGNYRAIQGISAATILGDGKIALIVDPDAVVAMASQTPPLSPLADMEFHNDRRAAAG
jgi:two-component system chemotaxis sensor kinase CheA